MTLKERMLNDLLDKYEKSTVYKSGYQGNKRRIMIGPREIEEHYWIRDNADRNREFIDILKELEAQKLVFFTWARFERDNLVNEFWLNTNPEAVEKTYQLIGRIPQKKKAEMLEEKIGALLPEIQADDIRSFLQDQILWLRENEKPSRFFFHAEFDKNDAILKLLAAVSQNTEEETERILSQRLFHDSKYFEKELKSRLLVILRYIDDYDDTGKEYDENLLRERGIVRYPEIMEFCGPISFLMDDGGEIDSSDEKYGAYVNSMTIRHSKELFVRKNIQRVLTIENKANYMDYILKEKKEDELVLFHGGFYSPIKGRFFRMIREALPDANYVHSGDIDLGGFRMFCRLKREAFPALVPFQMDIKTLVQYQKRAAYITDENYIHALQELLLQPEYEAFHSVIRFMVDHKLRLEQEALLY